MKIFKINLKEEGYFVEGGVLEAILCDEPFDVADETWKRPAVIVVPGGAYQITSKRECEPVALDFLSRGFQAFILHYQTQKDEVSYPQQLFQMASAVDCIKKHAKAWRVNEDEVFVVGFSAGGHLVGNLCVAHHRVSQMMGQTINCKPTAVGLGYPVIAKKCGYRATHENLLSGYTDEAKEEVFKEVELDELVTPDTPPAYLWTTATDRVVASQNTLRYAMALADNGVSYALHVFPQGEHGLSSATVEINAHQPFEAKMARGWLDECASFFARYTTELK